MWKTSFHSVADWPLGTQSSGFIHRFVLGFGVIRCHPSSVLPAAVSVFWVWPPFCDHCREVTHLRLSAVIPPSDLPAVYARCPTFGCVCVCVCGETVVHTLLIVFHLPVWPGMSVYLLLTHTHTAWLRVSIMICGRQCSELAHALLCWRSGSWQAPVGYSALWRPVLGTAPLSCT